MSDETYSVKVVCNNCQYEGTVDIHKGTRVSDWHCPKCDCRTLNTVKLFTGGKL